MVRVAAAALAALGALTSLVACELTLLQLDPYPETPGEIASDDCRATLALYERLEGLPDRQ